MKYLVTGANGFIGSKLLKLLSENGNSVIAIIRGKDSNIDNITGIENVRFIYCNMDDIERIVDDLNGEQIDCCIHLAWQGANGDGRKNVELQLKNVNNTINLCYALSKLKINRFVGVGTLAEIDANYYIPLDGATPNMTSAYGVSKLATYYMTKLVCTNLGIDHIWCRLSNLYGIGDKTNNFVNFAVRKMLRNERAAFTSGEQLYDFVDIRDAVKGIYCVAANGKKNSTYFVGSSNPKKLKDYIMQIRNTIDPQIEVFLGEVPFNGISLPPGEYSCEKTTLETGYVPEYRFEDEISELVNWMKGMI